MSTVPNLLVAPSAAPLLRLWRDPRYRRAVFAAVTGVAARGSTMVVQFLTVPLCLGYLGADVYGLWMALMSFYLILNFADVGMSPGMINEVTEARASGALERVRVILSSVLAARVVMSLVLGLVLFAGARVYDPARFFDPRGVLPSGTFLALYAVVCGAFLVSLPVLTFRSLHVALQETHVTNLWQCLGQALVLASLAIAVHAGASVGVLALCLALGPTLAVAVGGLNLVARQPHLKPSFRAVSGGAIRRMTGTGKYFFVAQLCYLINYQIDGLFILHFLGPSDVAVYVVAQKLFLIPMTLQNLLAMPFWPAMREALVVGDRGWIRLAFLRVLAITLLTTVPICVAAALGGEAATLWWTGGVIAVPFGVLALMAVWTAMNAVTILTAVLITAANAVRFHALFSVLTAAANIGLSLALVGPMGIEGKLLGSVISGLLFTVIPYGLFSWLFFRGRGRG